MERLVSPLIKEQSCVYNISGSTELCSLAYYFFLKKPNRSSRIVCIGVRWNLLGQVGGYPGGGSAS